jgi:hypothetical protein
MRALTVFQPFAVLIALGEKRVETRSRQTVHRGELAIHAGQPLTEYALRSCYREPVAGVLARAGLQVTDLRRGCIVAVATLVDVVQTKTHVQVISPQERAFGDYTEGRWAWLLENVRVVDPPVYCRGWQHVWRVTPEDERLVRAQVKP